MSTEPTFYYSRTTLAEACGITVNHVDYHVRAGTCRLDQAKMRIPKLGIVFKPGLCAQFIGAMQAKNVRKIRRKQQQQQAAQEGGQGT